MTEIDAVITALKTSTAALANEVRGLSPQQVNGPSALTGWSRGHLLTHLARNADGLRNLLLCARSGKQVSMYASARSRNADIDAGATRPPSVIVDDCRHASHALKCEIDDLALDKWSQPVAFHTTTGTKQQPACEIVHMRLREVEIHHVDLDVGHGFSATAPETLHPILDHAVERLGGQIPQRLELTASDLGVVYTMEPAGGSNVPVVAASATAAQLLGHLTGRGDPVPGVPPLPAWG